MNKKSLIVALGVLALTVPVSAAQAAPSGSERFNPIKAKVDAKVLPQSVKDDSSVNVIVQMADDPVAVVQAKAERKLSDSEKSSIRATLKSKQDAVKGSIAAQGGKVTGQMQSAYNGVQVTVSRQKVEQLASLPGVVAVHALTQQTPDNAVSVPYLGVPSVWQNTGYTGKGVKVGIIDTGIDYTHADFGGPGTEAAYAAAKAKGTQVADAALFGPNAPRVKGGFDLAGDGYDATGKKGSTTPTPDPNPLDCTDAGHGTHVAGTTAGGGVTAAGAAYSGPYDATTATKEWNVGPGVAPQADIYSYRVFGCFGSTDLTTQAIDMAVKDGMDVINMSLGSPFGLPDDPSAVAASNAVGAGVVVVASAGNSGPNPYIVGSPSTGAGVISVAAMDSTASFPGAVMTFQDASTMKAILANGLSPLPAGPFKVVILTDDPDTPENEALGCSVAAYTKAGVVAGGNQIAVSNRGVCARVAKAVYAQKAGAAAALMINNSGSYPPYEGPIVSNPDDGSAYEVTIPFLGVRSTDGAKVRAQNGKTIALTAQALANPNFTGYADFSSGGPRSFDSGAKPSVTAPGVATKSAGVGTGTGSETMSGTSMAAPHVAGVAALTVQAHKGWGAQDLSAALVNTANADKTAGYRLTLGGAGEVNPAGSVATKSVLLGDKFTTTDGVTMREPVLSFGFGEFGLLYLNTKTMFVKNNSDKAVTYTLTTKATPQSKTAKMTVFPSTLTVPARSSLPVTVTMNVDPANIPSSVGGSFQFYEVSGSVLAKGSDGSSLGMPYLMVPRSTSNADVFVNGKINDREGGATAVFSNLFSKAGAGLDFYTWGLSDPKDVKANSMSSGIDLRAAGVQAYPADGTLVFAVNNWTRFSNPAVNEYDVNIDTNGDGKADYVVFSADFGSITAGNPSGKAATFVYNVAKKSMYASAYTVAPTDSSTLLMQVGLSDLGLTAAKGTFKYTVESFSGEDGTITDSFKDWATYNPYAKPIPADGQGATVAAGKTLTMRLPIDKDAYKANPPLGLMVVAIDNAAGAPEALLIEGNR